MASARPKPRLVGDPPPAPDTLSSEGAASWDHTVEMWTLTGPDLELLASGLEQFDVYRNAMEQVREEGLTVTNPTSGNTRAHPALAVAHAALRAYRQVLTHLDLELPEQPRARGSVSRRRR